MSVRGASAVWLFLSLFFLLVPCRASAQDIVEYYGLDAVGSVRIVFNSSGTVTGRMDHSPFGEQLSASTVGAKSYAHLFRDGDAGFDYAEARMYQARTGRFNAPDPVYAGLFQPQAWNRYAYAANSPLVFTDPSGSVVQSGTTASCSDPEWRSRCDMWAWLDQGLNGGGAYVDSGGGWDGSWDGSEGGGGGSSQQQGRQDSGAGSQPDQPPTQNTERQIPDGPCLSRAEADQKACVDGMISGMLPVGGLTKAGAKLLPRVQAKLPSAIRGFIAKYMSYPTKSGGGGYPQFYDPKSGRYLDHLAPLWRSPSQFVIGVTEGWMAPDNAPLPGAITPWRQYGQWTGSAFGNMLKLWGR